MKQGYKYFAFFIAGFIISTLLMFRVFTTLDKHQLEGNILSNLIYIEQMDKSNFVVSRDELIKNVNFGLDMLIARLDNRIDRIFYPCDDDTQRIINMAAKYVDNRKLPNCI